MALTAGIKTKGKSSSEIRKAIEKAAKKDKSVKDQLDQLKIQQAKADIAKTLKGDTEEEKVSFSDYLSQSQAEAGSIVGTDGKIDPVDWNAAKLDWMNKGYTEKLFDANFGKFINKDREAEYTVTK